MSFAPSPPFPEESRSLLHKGQYLQRSSYLQDHSYSFFSFFLFFFYFFLLFGRRGRAWWHKWTDGFMVVITLLEETAQRLGAGQEKLWLKRPALQLPLLPHTEDMGLCQGSGKTTSILQCRIILGEQTLLFCE